MNKMTDPNPWNPGDPDLPGEVGDPEEHIPEDSYLDAAYEDRYDLGPIDG